MQYWIIETLWMNKERNKGLKEYYEVINEACIGKEGIELLGFYRPVNEGWNWAHFLKTNNLDKWRKLDNEINKKYANINDNITNTMARIFEGSDQFKQPPIPKMTDSMDYIVLEAQLWEGVDIGLREYYSMQCDLFDGVEGAWLYGIYVPWEGLNWAFLYMFDSLSKYFDLNMEWFKRYGRPVSLISSELRIYERIEP